MGNRPLLPQERALISISVAFCTLPAAGQSPADRVLLLRLMALCAAIADMADAPRFQIEHGPVEGIYWASRDLIKGYGNKKASHGDRKREARFLASHVFHYFDTRSVIHLHGLDLDSPDPKTFRAGAL